MAAEAQILILTTYDIDTRTHYGHCPDYPGMGIFSGKDAESFRDSFDEAYSRFSLTNAFRQSPLHKAAVFHTPMRSMSSEQEEAFRKLTGAPRPAAPPVYAR